MERVIREAERGVQHIGGSLDRGDDRGRTVDFAIDWEPQLSASDLRAVLELRLTMATLVRFRAHEDNPVPDFGTRRGTRSLYPDPRAIRANPTWLAHR